MHASEPSAAPPALSNPSCSLPIKHQQPRPAAPCIPPSLPLSNHTDMQKATALPQSNSTSNSAMVAPVTTLLGRAADDTGVAAPPSSGTMRLEVAVLMMPAMPRGHVRYVRRAMDGWANERDGGREHARQEMGVRWVRPAMLMTVMCHVHAMTQAEQAMPLVCGRPTHAPTHLDDIRRAGR